MIKKMHDAITHLYRGLIKNINIKVPQMLILGSNCYKNPGPVYSNYKSNSK